MDLHVDRTPDPTASGVTATRWARVMAVYGCGVLAAVALGEVAPATPAIRAELGMSLPVAGWAASLVTAVAAAVGVLGGAWTDRLGDRRALLYGMVGLAVTGVAEALAWSPAALLVIRCAQGAGYLLVVVAAPPYLLGLARPADRTGVLALWGTFVPVGIAVAAGAGGAVTAAAGWRGWFASVAVATALAVVAVRLRMPDEVPGPAGTARTGTGSPRDARRHVEGRVEGRGGATVGPVLRGVLSLSSGFGLVSMISVAVLTLLPTFLSDRAGLGGPTAGLLTALVSLVSVPGGLAAGVLMRRGAGLRELGPLGLAMPLAALLLVADAGRPPLAATGAAALLFVNGVLIAFSFAAVPGAVTGDPARLGLANGLLTQFGCVGSLLGPPVYTAGVDHAGWAAVPVLVACGVVAALGLLAAARTGPVHAVTAAATQGARPAPEG